MIITIEAEHENRLEEIQNEFIDSGYIIDFIHHAFYFADDVEKLLSGEITISMDEALGKEPPKFNKNSNNDISNNLDINSKVDKTAKPKKRSADLKTTRTLKRDNDAFD